MDTQTTRKVIPFPGRKAIVDENCCPACGNKIESGQLQSWIDGSLICSQCAYKKAMQEIGTKAVAKGTHWLEEGYAEGEVEMLKERATMLMPGFPVGILPTTLPNMMIDLGKQAANNMLLPDAFFFLGAMVSDKLETVDGKTGRKILSGIDEPLEHKGIGDFIRSVTNGGKEPQVASSEAGVITAKVMFEPLEKWICDHCRGVVGAEEGVVAWQLGKDGLIHNFKILHQHCAQGEGYAGFESRPVHPAFMGHRGISTMLSMLMFDCGHPGGIVKDVREYARFFARLHYPFFEEALPHLSAPEYIERLKKYGPLNPIPFPELAKICETELRKLIEANTPQ